MFNIKKYSLKRFHKNDLLHKKIEALFLLYDKRVHDMNLNYKGRIKLINIFIKDLIRYEEYELAKAFKDRKIRKYKKWRKQRRKYNFYLIYRLCKFKITKKILNIFRYFKAKLKAN